MFSHILHARRGRIRFFGFRWSWVICGVALLACSGDGLLTAPSPPSAAEILLVSGNNQEGKAGDPLAVPFVVRVTDASGVGVRNVAVTWRVTSGAGRFRDQRGSILSASTTRTGPEGLARITFEPLALDRATVEAALEDHTDLSVTFTAKVTGVVIDLWLWIIGPDNTSDVTVPVGTLVEWRNWLSSAHVTSSSVPAGGASFDSGILGKQDRFQFVPDVAGTWEYTDQVSGLRATLTARSGAPDPIVSATRRAPADLSGPWSWSNVEVLRMPRWFVEAMGPVLGISAEGENTHARCESTGTMTLLQTGVEFAGTATRTFNACETTGGQAFQQPGPAFNVADGRISGRSIHFSFHTATVRPCPHHAKITGLEGGGATALGGSGRCVLPGHPQSESPLAFDPPPGGTSTTLSWKAWRP